MEIKVDRMRQVLNLVAPVVARKTSVPILTSVLFADGQVRAFNLEQEIVVPVPEMGADERFVMPHRVLQDTLKYMGGSQTLHVANEDGEIKLEGAGSRLTVRPGGEPDDFPPPMPFPTLGVEIKEAALDGDALLQNLQAVVGCCAAADSHPVLTGVAMFLGDRLTVAGADGFRLAYQETNIKMPALGEQKVIVLPAQAVTALSRVWKIADKPPEMTGDIGSVTGSRPSIHLARLVVAKRMMRVTYIQERIRFHFGNVMLASNLIEGSFPQYDQLIPTDPVCVVTLDAEEVTRALGQVGEMAVGGSGIVRLNWTENQVEVSARAEDEGTVTVTLPAKANQAGHIAFNHRYLAELFKGKEGPVVMETKTPSSPALFVHRGQRGVVLMPMFVQWDGGPAWTEAVAPGSGPEEPEEHDPADCGCEYLGNNIWSCGHVDQADATNPPEGYEEPPPEGEC